MKKAQKLNQAASQTLRITRARSTGGVKVCPKALERIIEWANLPGESELPELHYLDFREADGMPPEFLPAPVRLNLLETISNRENWRKPDNPKEWDPKEWREESGEALSSEREEWLRNQFVAVFQSEAAAERYALIRGSREALIAVTGGAEVFPVTTFLKREGTGKEAKATYAGDPISDALLDAEIHYIRRCEACGRFFYAQRDNQETCPPEIPGKPSRCAGAKRARDKRNNDREKREREERKRATAARKR